MSTGTHYPRCKTCRFYAKLIDNGRLGRCDVHGSFVVRGIAPDYPQAKILASLITESEFGCVHHSPRTQR